MSTLRKKKDWLPFRRRLPQLKTWLLVFFITFGVLVPQVSCARNRVSDRIALSNESVVYITKTGKKYHRSDCQYLSKSKLKISLKDAKKNGYGACKVCKP